MIASLLYRAADAARHRYRLRHATIEQTNGRRGEDIAHRYLRRRGLQIVARNFRARSNSGELDLIAWQGETLVFVEVKARSEAERGSPALAVGRDKERDLRRAAGEYLRRSGTPEERARFDVVSILLGDPPEIEWIPNAFPLSRKI